MVTLKIRIGPKERAEIKLVLDTLAAVVAEFGEDYVYKTQLGSAYCTYVRDGKPDCIAAQVLVRLGMSVEDLAQCEGKSCAQFGGYGTVPVGGEALHVLRQAQMVQDGVSSASPFSPRFSSPTWGEALRVARDYALGAYGIA